MHSAEEAAFLRSLADDLERGLTNVKLKLNYPTAQAMSVYRQARDALVPIEQQIQQLRELAHTVDQPSA